MRVSHVMSPYLSPFNSSPKAAAGLRTVVKVDVQVVYTTQDMSDTEDNDSSNLVSQITANPTTIEGLSQALIPSLLASLEAIASKKGEESDKTTPLESNGEQGRHDTGANNPALSLHSGQGHNSIYPWGNPAQQNQSYPYPGQ